MRMWSPSGLLSATGNKVKKITQVYSYSKKRASARNAQRGRGGKPLTPETVLLFIIKVNEQIVRLGDGTMTVSCKDLVLLTCCHGSAAH